MPGGIDQEVQTLINARGRRSVLKLRLLTLRQRLPNTIILAFEGPDDKLAYCQWISRLRPNLAYEPFNCKGKKQVLELHKSVGMDKAGLAEGVYFFVDRDFDDLAGYQDSDRLFMTAEYAIENSVVHEEALENLLKNEFHCDGAIEVREEIKKLFAKVREEFLSVSREHNRRLFVATRLELEVKKSDKIKDIAVVELEAVKASPKPITQAIVLPREPSKEEIEAYENEFSALHPGTRYRGKWLFQFFMKWLECLQEARAQGAALFKGADMAHAVNVSAISLQTLASKSPPPSGLDDFLATIPDAI